MKKRKMFSKFHFLHSFIKKKKRKEENEKWLKCEEDKKEKKYEKVRKKEKKIMKKIGDETRKLILKFNDKFLGIFYDEIMFDRSWSLYGKTGYQLIMLHWYWFAWHLMAWIKTFKNKEDKRIRKLMIKELRFKW